MKIGIMSDSHDNLNNIKKAIQIFTENIVESVIHAGDLISPFCIPPFKSFKGRFYLCSGNNLGDTELIQEKILEYGEFFIDMGEFDLDNKKFALYHGTNTLITNALLGSQKYDYVVIGHTHKTEVKEIEKTILINPGETFGDLYGTASVAILDTVDSSIKFHEL
ncbi:MAG: metallophosphoesterase [Candidatus Heimdallarchaeota archaeon]